MLKEITVALTMCVLITIPVGATTTPAEFKLIPETTISCKAQFGLRNEALVRESEALREYVLNFYESIRRQSSLTPKEYERIKKMFEKFNRTTRGMAEKVIASAAGIADDAVNYLGCLGVANWALDVRSYAQDILDSTEE